MSENTREARGPFKSIADAEKWLKADAEENFRSMNELERLGEDRKWAVPVLIVEEKKKMQQIPVIDVKINLEEAK